PPILTNATPAPPQSQRPRPGVPPDLRHTGRVVDSSLLSAVGLTKRYPGAVALDGLTVDVPRGLVGLVGANGAGKTTLFRLLLGLARPTEGTVEVCGRSVAADPVGSRARMGYMPEHDCLPLDQS